jgi:hypothetical protein
MSTNHERRRTADRARALLSILIVGAAVSACGAADQPASPTSTVDTTTTAMTTSSAPPEPQAVPVPDNGFGMQRAPSTIFQECDARKDSSGELSFNETAQIFNPKTGSFVTMRTPTVPTGQKVIGDACTVGGEGDNTRIFHVTTFAVPSSGLTPESTSTSVFAFDPYSDAPAQSVQLVAPFAPYKDESNTENSALPSKYGFVFVRKNPKASRDYIGFDGTTLKRAIVVNSDLPFDTHVNFSAIAVGTTVFSLKDGRRITQLPDPQTVSSLHAGGVVATFPKGFLAVLAEYPRQTYGFFDTDDNKFKTPYPRTGVVYGDKFLYLDEDYLEVRDIRTNTVLFRLDGPRFAGLHVSGFR